jgi:hypothetical protein
MKLKFIRNWRQCLFKRFQFYCKKLEKTGRNISKIQQNSCTQHPAFKPAKVLLKEKINNEAVKY